MEIKLVETCSACPEQYDAFNEWGGQVGYLRLRHGLFSVYYPDSDGERIYRAFTKGDGVFDWDERTFYLNEAKNAIRAQMEFQAKVREYAEKEYAEKLLKE